MDNTDRNTYPKWRFALLTGFFGGTGGVLHDTDHILSAITGGQIPWSFLHNSFVVGIIIGLLGGLLVSLVLTSVLTRIHQTVRGFGKGEE